VTTSIADQHRPREQGGAAQGDPRCPQRQHGGDDREGGDEQRHRDRRQRQDVEADAVGLGAERPAVDRVGGEHDAARCEPHPVGRGAGAGEGDRRGADLERHDGGGEAEQQRQDAEEQRGRRVEREQAQRRVGLEDLVARGVALLELDQRPDDAGGEQEDQRGPDEQLADGAGIARADRSGQPRRRHRRGRGGGGLCGGVAGSFGHGHGCTLVRRRAVLGNLVTWL
jgi:hypothetical protein